MTINIQSLAISSVDIAPLRRIPDEFTADLGNKTPELAITGVPADTVELAVLLHDPDAPIPNGFTHWVVYGIEPDTEKIRISEQSSARLGTNGIGEGSYSGPQPPRGHGTHHYYFWVFALDTKVDGEPTREEFLASYGGNVIEQNRFVATYDRE